MEKTINKIRIYVEGLRRFYEIPTIPSLLLTSSSSLDSQSFLEILGDTTKQRDYINKHLKAIPQNLIDIIDNIVRGILKCLKMGNIELDLGIPLNEYTIKTLLIGYLKANCYDYKCLEHALSMKISLFKNILEWLLRLKKEYLKTKIINIELKKFLINNDVLNILIDQQLILSLDFDTIFNEVDLIEGYLTKRFFIPPEDLKNIIWKMKKYGSTTILYYSGTGKTLRSLYIGLLLSITGWHVLYINIATNRLGDDLIKKINELKKLRHILNNFKNVAIIIDSIHNDVTTFRKLIRIKPHNPIRLLLVGRIESLSLVEDLNYEVLDLAQSNYKIINNMADIISSDVIIQLNSLNVYSNSDIEELKLAISRMLFLRIKKISGVNLIIAKFATSCIKKQLLEEINRVSSSSRYISLEELKSKFKDIIYQKELISKTSEYIIRMVSGALGTDHKKRSLNEKNLRYILYILAPTSMYEDYVSYENLMNSLKIISNDDGYDRANVILERLTNMGIVNKYNDFYRLWHRDFAKLILWDLVHGKRSNELKIIKNLIGLIMFDAAIGATPHKKSVSTLAEFGTEYLELFVDMFVQIAKSKKLHEFIRAHLESFDKIRDFLYNFRYLLAPMRYILSNNYQAYIVSYLEKISNIIPKKLNEYDELLDKIIKIKEILTPIYRIIRVIHSNLRESIYGLKYTKIKKNLFASILFLHPLLDITINVFSRLMKVISNLSVILTKNSPINSIIIGYSTVESIRLSMLIATEIHAISKAINGFIKKNRKLKYLSGWLPITRYVREVVNEIKKQQNKLPKKKFVYNLLKKIIELGHKCGISKLWCFSGYLSETISICSRIICATILHQLTNIIKNDLDVFKKDVIYHYIDLLYSLTYLLMITQSIEEELMEHIDFFLQASKSIIDEISYTIQRSHKISFSKFKKYAHYMIKILYISLTFYRLLTNESKQNLNTNFRNIIDKIRMNYSAILKKLSKDTLTIGWSAKLLNFSTSTSLCLLVLSNYLTNQQLQENIRSLTSQQALFGTQQCQLPPAAPIM